MLPDDHVEISEGVTIHKKLVAKKDRFLAKYKLHRLWGEDLPEEDAIEALGELRSQIDDFYSRRYTSKKVMPESHVPVYFAHIDELLTRLEKSDNKKIRGKCDQVRRLLARVAKAA